MSTSSTSELRPPVPPFTLETAIQKIRGAEDGWNSRDPERVSLVYTPDSLWRNRAEFVRGRAEIVEFLKRKWARELDYRPRPLAVGMAETFAWLRTTPAWPG